MSEDTSNSAARKFIEANKLMDKYSNIVFKGDVTIETEHSHPYNGVHKLRFHNEHYSANVLDIHDSDTINKFKYPTNFQTVYQEYSINNDGDLVITGEHTDNPKIGKYTVTITQLGRTKL